MAILVLLADGEPEPCIHSHPYTEQSAALVTVAVTVKVIHCYPLCKLGNSHAEFPAVCNPTCQNGGTCSSPNTCSCRSGWTGYICSQRKLNTIMYLLKNIILFPVKRFVLLHARMVEHVQLLTRALVPVDGLAQHAYSVCYSSFGKTYYISLT